MGLYLIGMAFDAETLLTYRDTAIAVLEVAIGLGLVIFVHELGHFSVAKMCGVKCEKFYLGFDIGGLRFCRFRWGETEYGIGILPLGGYVKMLGQEDNPARLKEEIERARTNAEMNAEEVPSQEEVAHAEQALYDPRSFLAQSVPKRMAIISAGVIMNLIFAFIMAAVAYGIGVRQAAPGVGVVVSGEAAWRENLQGGDQILEIAGRKLRRFRDLQESISLGDAQNGIPIVIQRPGVPEPLTVIVKPDEGKLLPRIGITNPCSTTLAKQGLYVMPGSAAALAKPPFEAGDRVIKMDGQPIDNFGQVQTCLARNLTKPIEVVVERPMLSAEGKPQPTVRQKVTIDLPPQPMRRLGLEMGLGKIVAIQKNSPADTAGLQPGDLIQAVDNQPVGDPLTLPDRLQARVGQTVVLRILPEGSNAPRDVSIQLREPSDYSLSAAPGSPVAVPELGFAYETTNQVQAVLPNSPAAQAGLQPGDELVRAVVLPPDAATLRKLKATQYKATVEFTDEMRNWPYLLCRLNNDAAPGTRVELHWQRKGAEQQATLTPVEMPQWLIPNRGLLFEPIFVFLKADSLGQALAEGGKETLNATSLVYRTLHGLGSKVSLKALGGPVMIFQAAKHAAEEGIANLLIFLTVLSANLAVLNFLPIPLLDGGLMVFLLWEGIRGKPANEHVQVVLTYIGLAFIILLTVWVCGLDFGLIPRQ